MTVNWFLFTIVAHVDFSDRLEKERGGREWGLSFLRSPVEIYPSPATGRVSGVRLEINTLEVGDTIFHNPFLLWVGH